MFYIDRLVLILQPKPGYSRVTFLDIAGDK